MIKLTSKVRRPNLNKKSPTNPVRFNRYMIKGSFDMYAEEKNWFDAVENSIKKDILDSANRILKAKINLRILPKISEIKKSIN